MGYPVIFQSNDFLTANLVANQIISPDERQFLNRTQSWLRVRSIGIASRILTGDHAEPLNFSSHNGTVGFSPLDWMIRIGPTNITPDFIPVESCAYSVAGEEYSLTLPFRRPVYLAPLDRIQIQARYRSAIIHENAQRFYFFARCEVVERPQGLFVPALMGWRGSEYGAVGAFTIDVPFSTFQNDAAEPLEVDRFIAKLTVNNAINARYAILSEFKICMELQDGTRITREAQPLGALAEIGKQSWTPGITLPPNGYIKIDCEGSLDDANMPTITPHFGLIGYREIG
jgi:hypothetical protein